MINLILAAIFFVFLPGCATQVISPQILAQVDRQISFNELQKAPRIYKGKMVLLGGVIVKTENKKEGTLLEIYQTKLDNQDRPVNIDSSQGRFLALYKGFLDSEIYKTGRRVTIAGIVQDEKIDKLGEINYRYPYIIISEIYLFQTEKPSIYYPYPYYDDYPWYPYYYPDYPFYPWRLRYRPYWPYY